MQPPTTSLPASRLRAWASLTLSKKIASKRSFKPSKCSHLLIPWYPPLPPVRCASPSVSLHKLIPPHLFVLPSCPTLLIAALDTIRSRTGSLWTRTRHATKAVPVTFHLHGTAPPRISTCDYAEPVLAKDACRFLHNITRDSEAKTLHDLRDQGKVALALHNDRFANGSSWLFTGLNLHFKDWRFIHRARLNLLPTNAVKSTWSDCDPTCHHCKQPETLPHMLCHCPPNMPATTDRYNKIVEHLTNAVQYGSVSTDKTVADSHSPMRPDIVIEQDNKVTIIDVCCPFENSEEALEEAAARKELKYEHLRAHFEAQGKTCSIFGFAVGALDAWHPGNGRVLSALDMSPHYNNLFRKRCCTDVIQGSTDIYRQHLGCDDVLN